MPTTEATPRSPAESARTALEEVRDALRELTQAVTKLQRTVRASSRSPKRRPPRTEVGFIDIASTEVESTVTVTKKSWSGATREEEEVVKTKMNQLVAFALGLNGRYEVSRSEPFKLRWNSITPENPAEVGSILNEFLASLIQEGWVVTPPSRYAGRYRDWVKDGKVPDGQAYERLSLRRAVTE